MIHSKGNNKSICVEGLSSNRRSHCISLLWNKACAHAHNHCRVHWVEYKVQCQEEGNDYHTIPSSGCNQHLQQQGCQYEHFRPAWWEQLAQTIRLGTVVVWILYLGDWSYCSWYILAIL